jgi:hypothetical protein
MTDIIFIDTDRAIELLREVVAEFGRDYRYEKVAHPHGGEGCLYVNRGECSCLVAHALHRVGVEVEDLSRMDGYDDNDDTEIGTAYRRLPPHVELTEGAVQVFAAAQTAQDHGRVWGTALEEAVERGQEIGGPS